MLPAPKIVKAESNRTDLHAKIAEPPPIFYKDSEKNTPCQMKRHLSMFRRSRSVAFFGSFRRRCFSGKSPLSDGLEDRVGKNAFSSVLRVVFSSPVFSYFCIFFLYSSARCSGRIRSSCLRAKPFRICPAFCLPNYELTPISESMCESPFRCRCVVAEDAGFARKRVDYMIDVIRKTPLVRSPNRRGIK